MSKTSNKNKAKKPQQSPNISADLDTYRRFSRTKPGYLSYRVFVNVLLNAWDELTQEARTNAIERANRPAETVAA